MKNVLVCLTRQKECERLIRYGKELIMGSDARLMVVHIAGYGLEELKDGDGAANLEYLHQRAVEHEANLTIIRSDNVVATLVSLVEHFDISRIVMGETRQATEADSTTQAFKDLSFADVEIIVVPEETAEEASDI